MLDFTEREVQLVNRFSMHGCPFASYHSLRSWTALNLRHMTPTLENRILLAKITKYYPEEAQRFAPITSRIINDKPELRSIRGIAEEYYLETGGSVATRGIPLASDRQDIMRAMNLLGSVAYGNTTMTGIPRTVLVHVLRQLKVLRATDAKLVNCSNCFAKKETHKECPWCGWAPKARETKTAKPELSSWRSSTVSSGTVDANLSNLTFTFEEITRNRSGS